MVKTFIDLILEESKNGGGTLSRLTNKAVYLLAWLRRYQKDLFSNWKMPEVSVFILFGKCATTNEALFLRFLARLPVDVLILLPNLNEGSSLQDPALLELRFDESLPLEKFPVEPAQMRVSTAAYQAERIPSCIRIRDCTAISNMALRIR